MVESPGAVVVGTGFGSRVHVPALRAAGFSVEALVGTDPVNSKLSITVTRAKKSVNPNADGTTTVGGTTNDGVVFKLKK